MEGYSAWVMSQHQCGRWNKDEGSILCARRQDTIIKELSILILDPHKDATSSLHTCIIGSPRMYKQSCF